MKHLLIILFTACICMCATAQTPYDSFAPETSRPILDMEALSEMHTLSHQSPDTMLCALVIDTSQEQMFLIDVSDGEIIAYAPITDDIRKWMSVDPLTDKYPSISPYAYCDWNPINAIDPDGRNPRTGLPGKEMNGVWQSAQNTTYIEGRTSFAPIQLPTVEYVRRLAADPGTIQPTFTMEKYLQNIPEQDVALITNPAIQIAAVAVMGIGVAAIGSEIVPVVMNMETGISTYINASLYPAFESSVPMQIGTGVIEGFIKGIIPGTDLAPNMYSSPAYQIGSEIGNSSVYIINELNNLIRTNNEGQ